MSNNVKFDPSIIDSILMDVNSENNKSDKKEKIKQEKVDLNNATDSFISQLISSSNDNQNNVEDDKQKQDDNERQVVNEIDDEKIEPQVTNKNQIISNISSQVDKLSLQLSQDKTNLVSGRNGEVVNYNHVYEELNSLIIYAKETLETLAAIEPDIIDPKQIQATASLISSIRGLVSEFSMIHRMNIKHQYNIELENIKQQHRLNTIEYKQEVRNQNNSDVVGNATIVNNNSIPWSNDLILEFMEFMKQKGQK